MDFQAISSIGVAASTELIGTLPFASLSFRTMVSLRGEVQVKPDDYFWESSAFG